MTEPAPGIALGLPARVRACLFDLDGVLTDTAKLHAAAWKEMCDGFLTARAEQTGSAFVAFDEVGDYDTYVDGKGRSDGARSFLQSRSVELPPGAVPSSANTAAGIADLFQIHIDGLSVEEQHLAGKPAPDTYLAAAKVLGVKPGDAAVFEDALSGVAAGRAGGFVVGVDRLGRPMNCEPTEPIAS